MDIEKKAYEFAAKAHKGQKRKSDKLKPFILHPIEVSLLIKEYGFDSNVVSAGLLHDVVEDTKYKIEDIEKEFGSDIASLVMGDSEPDKSLSWEERKKHTIKTIKKLDLRHKAVVCCDKISNLSDMQILFEEKGEYDFSAFKRGFDDQKWYYESIYKSLIFGEDKNLEMFKRLNSLIRQVFYFEDDKFIKDKIFEGEEEYYKKLRNLNIRRKELEKLKKYTKMNTFVIEFTGTPRTGKTTLINNLYDFFKKGGFKVEVIEEFTTSKRYKKEIYPLLKDKYKNIVNTEIPKYVRKELEDNLEKDFDIIIVDRCLFDRLIWVDRLYLKDGMSEEEYTDYKKEYIPLIEDKIDIIIGTYCDSVTALKRDYFANLSLDERHFLNKTNVDEYNKSFKRMKKLNKNICFIDTDCSMREVSIKACDSILSKMREKYLEILNKKF